ncbi:hypothetical protein GALMADRAFT_1210046 [Galerina marginata CBS 339.88]|uniref:Uncharacterized protein n=1 Tax=Galerina marginata (strain CBS 339.88) TaxID=685588 RepID=A0A067SE73_GALM3|nr:hypothetical protein GALMADRAFT_1210046 [Galerina marginata CBS 339.88]
MNCVVKSDKPCVPVSRSQVKLTDMTGRETIPSRKGRKWKREMKRRRGGKGPNEGRRRRERRRGERKDEEREREELSVAASPHSGPLVSSASCPLVVDPKSNGVHVRQVRVEWSDLEAVFRYLFPRTRMIYHRSSSDSSLPLSKRCPIYSR